MSVRMDEIVLDQHVKESLRPQTSNNRLQGMLVHFIMRDGDTLHKLLHEHGIWTFGFNGRGEKNVVSFFEEFLENQQILFLIDKVDLIMHRSLHGVLSNWDCEGFWKKWENSAEEEKQIYISFNVFVDPWVSDLDGDILPLILCLVNLAHRPRCYGLRIELLEYLIYLFSIASLEVSFGLSVGMFWRMLPQMNKFISHLLPNDVSPVTHVLKSLNPDNSCPFDGTDKRIQPIVSASLEDPYGE